MDFITGIVFGVFASIGLLLVLTVAFCCIDGVRSFVKAVFNLEEPKEKEEPEERYSKERA